MIKTEGDRRRQKERENRRRQKERERTERTECPTMAAKLPAYAIVPDRG